MEGDQREKKPTDGLKHDREHLLAKLFAILLYPARCDDATVTGRANLAPSMPTTMPRTKITPPMIFKAVPSTGSTRPPGYRDERIR
jgi:hypothetical protein